MSNNKSRIIKITTILMIFVILFMSITNAQTMEELRVKTETDEWFSDESITKLAGNVVTWGSTDGGFSQDRTGAYCIDEHSGDLSNQTEDKTINAVIDINNDEVENGSGKIIVYAKDGKTYTYNVSDSNNGTDEGKGIYEVLRLAYLAKVATQRGEQGVNIYSNDGTWGTAKFAMSTMFATTDILQNLNKINVGVGMSTSGLYDGTDWSNIGWKGTDEVNTDLNNAAYEATATVSTIKDKTLNPENVGMEIKDGKTFIGPYKIAYTGGTIKDIKIITETETINVDSIANANKSEITGITNLKSDEDFYIVVNKEITNQVKDITISVNGVKASKARIIVLESKHGQNFIAYRGKESDNSADLHLSTPKLGTLEIQKVDQFKDSKVSLKDIEFKVYANNKGWVVRDGEKISFNKETNAFDNIEPFKTDENGKITIKNLPTGTYQIFETGLPKELEEIYQIGERNVPTIPNEGKRKAKLVISTIEGIDYRWPFFYVNAGQTATVRAVNDRAYTDVVIEKVDKDSGEKLNGVEFVLYRVKDEDNKTEEGFVEADDNNVATGKYTDYEHAKRLITVNGVTPKLTKLPVGTYELYEVGAGEKSNLYSIGTFAKNGQKYKGNLVDTKQIKATESGEFKFTVENVQEYIKISGYVFEKQLTGKNKTGYENLTDFTNDDKKIEGIQVKLIDYYTGQEQVTTTDANGAYSFDKVRIRYSGDSEKVDYLSNYLVVYEYDGFRYQGVLTDINKRDKYQTEKNNTKVIHPTSAKAVEKTDDTLQLEYTREKLNDLFKEITGEGQELSNGVKLQYEKQENGEYTLKNISKRTVVPEQDKVPEHIKIDRIGDFEVQSTTAGTLLQEYYDFLKNNSKNKAVEEITGLNFGVYQREMSEVNVMEDVYNVQLKIKNSTYTYMHNRRANTNSETVLGAKFDDYNQPIYKADVNYDDADDSKELKASVMYKVQLDNLSTNIDQRINEISNWYSPSFAIKEVYVSDSPNEKQFNDSNRLKCSIKTSDEKNGFVKSQISFESPIEIAKQKDTGKTYKYLYIRYDLNNIKEIMTDETDTTRSNLQNHVEISNYTLIKDGKLYAGIDRKSLPRNYVAENYKETDEQDSDRAPGLKLVDAGDRTLEGNVFEDNAVVSGAGKERKGNGIFDKDENTISGVKVELIDLDGNKVQQVYDRENGKWVDLDVKTSEDGHYVIKGFPVGTYQVVFTWGDDKYKVEDYKSTIFNEKDRLNHDDWYKTEDPRYSDAIDDYGIREAIDNEVLGLKNPEKTARYNRLLVEAAENKENNIKMKSYSPKCFIPVEKDEYTEVSDPLINDKTHLEFNVKNLDFGIIERPRQAMEINKNLSAVKLNTNDGQPIANARIKDGKLEVITGEKYVSGGPDLGYIWVQVDKSITQGMKAEMGYTITVTNTSELDYDDENYYKFGEIPSGNAKTMTMKADQVFDYSKGAELTANEVNSSWEVLTPAKYDGKEKTRVEENFEEQLSKAVDSEGNITENYEWNSAYEVTKTIFTDWLEQLAQTKKTDVRTVKLANRDIIHYVGTELTKALKPGESASAEINTSKIVANSDEIRFDNDAEITHFSYETDRKTGTIPNARTSKLIDRGGWVSITPATGEDRDYTWIVVTAVSAIALLGAGIIFIKKKVLK